MTLRVASLVALLAAAVVLGALPGATLPVARAQPAPSPQPAPTAQSSEAERLIRRANLAYRSGDYRVALALYEHAHRVERTGFLLFNMAQCHRKLGATAQAIELYEQYLAAEPGAPNREAVQRILVKLRSELPAAESPPRVPVPPPEPAPVAPLPRPAPELITPPPATVTAVPLAPVSPPPPVVEASPPWYRRWYVWAAVGALVVGGAVGGAVAATRSNGPIPDGYTNLGPVHAFGSR